MGALPDKNFKAKPLLKANWYEADFAQARYNRAIYTRKNKTRLT